MAAPPPPRPRCCRVQVHCLSGHEQTVCSILTQPTDPQVRPQGHRGGVLRRRAGLWGRAVWLPKARVYGHALGFELV
eukprot:365321-Chlamydomonas_euryale.AAC.24